VCTRRCCTCRRNAADEHRCSADAFSLKDGSAIRVLHCACPSCSLRWLDADGRGTRTDSDATVSQRCYTRDCRLSCLLIVSAHRIELQRFAAFSGGPPFSGPAFSAPPTRDSSSAVQCSDGGVTHQCTHDEAHATLQSTVHLLLLLQNTRRV